MGGAREPIRAAGRTVTLGNPDKELFDTGGVTKRELAFYYRAVAPVMLPHIRERPLAMQRFPHGIARESFYAKARPSYTPQWVASVAVPHEHGAISEMVMANDAATLVWLADQAAITLHPWLSRARDLHHPDRIVIDLDPGGDDFAVVRRAAHDTRAVLEGVGLACFVMTTGSRGVHVVAPIRPELDSADARRFAHIVAELIRSRQPDERTTEFRKNRRNGRLFVDYLRNGWAQLAVAPYAVRPLPGAPVATPLRWDELDGVPSARHWTVRDLVTADRSDPWRGLPRHARSPLRAIDRLE